MEPTTKKGCAEMANEVEPLVVEVTAEESRSNLVRTHRVRELLGYLHPDSVRQAAKAGRIKRSGVNGVYLLDSVLEYKAVQAARRGTGADE